MRTFWLMVYYGLASKLPKSNRPILGKFGGWLRSRCAKHLFAECKGYVNLEQGAYIGNGRNFHVMGSGVGIGKGFVCHNRIVTIHGSLLMGENVLFQGGGALLRRPKQTYRLRRQSSGYTIGDRARCVDRGESHYPARVYAYRCA